MATVTKKQLTEEVAMILKENYCDVKEFTQLFLDKMTEHLIKRNRIELRDFGVFSIKRRRPRKGRNPKKGDIVDVPAKNVVVFKVGKKLKDKVEETTEGAN